MEQLAAPDRIYLTEYTAALVAGFFRLRDLRAFTLKACASRFASTSSRAWVRIAHGSTSRAEVTGEAASALAHGRKAVNFAERTGSQLARIYAHRYLGVANVLNDAWHDALEVLGTALTIARERRLSLQEGGVLAAMAAANLGLGDHAKALAIAEEAIAVSRRLGA
jgi:hypothetical protein